MFVYKLLLEFHKIWDITGFLLNIAVKKDFFNVFSGLWT